MGKRMGVGKGMGGGKEGGEVGGGGRECKMGGGKGWITSESEETGPISAF